MIVKTREVTNNLKTQAKTCTQYSNFNHSIPANKKNLDSARFFFTQAARQLAAVMRHSELNKPRDVGL